MKFVQRGSRKNASNHFFKYDYSKPKSNFTNIFSKKLFLGRARCSHFQSVCYFAATIRKGKSLLGKPCTKKCPKAINSGILPGRSIPMGEDTPDE